MSVSLFPIILNGKIDWAEAWGKILDWEGSLNKTILEHPAFRWKTKEKYISTDTALHCDWDKSRGVCKKRGFE